MKAQTILLLFFICFPLKGLWGQDSILLKNPSFEADSPGAGKAPSDWINLGATHETPPDIQPGFFQVTMPAKDGQNYLGLVVRAFSTWEGIGQKLNDFLIKDTEYSFSLWLTRSNAYSSPLKGKSEIMKFNGPTVLKIWGYNTKTKQEELLAESQPVSHSKWVRYEFVLKPSLADFDELDLMAYYAPGHENENGNLLIDNCSAIVKIEK